MIITSHPSIHKIMLLIVFKVASLRKEKLYLVPYFKPTTSTVCSQEKEIETEVENIHNIYNKMGCKMEKNTEP